MDKKNLLKLITKNYNPLKTVKDVAYRIMVQSSSPYRNINDVLKAITLYINNDPEEIRYTGSGGDFWNDPSRNLIKLYLYGNTDNQFTEMPKESKGFDYTKYLQKIGYDDVKTYEGKFIPENTLYVHPKYKSAIENIKNMYVNDVKYIAFGDDVAHYKMTIDSDNGLHSFNYSDVWDFYPGDWNNIYNKYNKYNKHRNNIHNKYNKHNKHNKYSNIKDLDKQHILEYASPYLLDKIGNPFILRLNVPIEYTTDPEKLELSEKYLPEFFKNLPVQTESTIDEDGDIQYNFTLPTIEVTSRGINTAGSIKYNTKTGKLKEPAETILHKR